MTRPVCFLFAAAVVLSPFTVRAQEAAEPAVITRGPYPQAATQDAIHRVWRVRQNTEPVVRYGLSPETLDQQTGATAAKVRRPAAEGASTGGAAPLHSAPTETRQCEVHVTGLKPDTKYYYAIYDGATRLTPGSGDYSFNTLPVPGTGRPLLMWVLGDSGTGNRVQARVHTAMRGWLAKEKRTLDLYIHVGDMAYSKGLDTGFQGCVFQVYQDTLRNSVCWPCIGNHEGKTSVSATGSAGLTLNPCLIPADREITSGGTLPDQTPEGDD